MEKNRFFEVIGQNGKYGIKSTKENNVNGKERIMVPIIYDNLLVAGNETNEKSLTDKKLIGIKTGSDGILLYAEFFFSYAPGVTGSCDNLNIVLLKENLKESDYESKAIVRKLN